ncbi:MAG: phytanoyl-CoA dioxygenase family protein [Pseudomonadota bacterium]
MKITSEARDSGVLDAKTLARVEKSLTAEGYVVLEGVMPDAWVTATRELFAQQLATAYEHAVPRRGHGGLRAPLRQPFLDPLIIEHPIVFQVLQRVLGQRFYGCLPYGCNTAFPGSEAQNVHRDCGQLFPEVSTHVPPALIVVNIALDDFTVDNGATEIWPGSHRLPDTTQHEIDYLRVESSRTEEYPSTRVEGSAGSVVVRDMRTWHRGMPNSTDDARTMLALVYYRQYFLPDDLASFPPGETDIEWDQLSDRAIDVYRLRP